VVAGQARKVIGSGPSSRQDFACTSKSISEHWYSDVDTATMASFALLPFLYQTRTLRPLMRQAARAASIRHASYNRRDDAIPFEWTEGMPKPDETKEPSSSEPSTITPAEAEVFKSIFDEIAQGKMPAPQVRVPHDAMTSDDALRSTKNRPTAMQGGRTAMPRSIVEQARMTEFRDRTLQRYPSSLQDAAKKALGLFEHAPSEESREEEREMREAEKKTIATRILYKRRQAEERARVTKLMEACTNDHQLWSVMEEEVFSLPNRLGILDTPSSGAESGKRVSMKARKGKKAEKIEFIMDVQGPLYSHYISLALTMLDTAFARPSPRVFNILPRIKALGLPSYVLGVSTPFYARLASIYWDRRGDAASALDLLGEMITNGLYADEDVVNLLAKMKSHLRGCSLGFQGPFVKAMMDTPPYNGPVREKIEEMQRFARQSFEESARDYGLAE
jgi:hypothetical protein